MTDFFRQTAPLLAANLLAVIFILGIVRIDRYEKENGAFEVRLGDVAMTVAPLLVLLYGIYLWGGFEATPLRHWVGQPHTAQHQPLQAPQ